MNANGADSTTPSPGGRTGTAQSHRIQPDAVPTNVTMAAGRQLRVIKVPKYSRWQEISMRRMEFIQKAIDEEDIRRRANYISRDRDRPPQPARRTGRREGHRRTKTTQQAMGTSRHL
ncbi:hypothetical protein CRUP_014167 [Coryphaenoides rupestris]|nr:hypothetical protein CRUP_014167 [Coryphaenoides rupestris]